jgi:hypothetical protein
MSKAYDSVNLKMLGEAMKRIKIPEKIRNIITALFTG